MNWIPNIQTQQNKPYIFCNWRRKFVKLTPEENVRQHFLHALVEQYNYPASRIAVEQHIRFGSVDKRCDAIIYNQLLQPVCIIEFKAPNIQLTQNTFDQINTYNQQLNVPLLIISNGKQTYIHNTQLHTFINHIPQYDTLCTKR
ncbi:MAG: type I restriction enzyme HsdR N-terminal domain-containing protein [Paludibacter sp.]|nr:type I restriction enzyme HsdR N-terminal domain-containing protein [Bacteroidales bacterium]MCM1068426.1 type I restriction enzyme HsdR N-terminal domain-containing protein [Prevotella sp.]MCM1353381.1 type I restriction enzyme HsdR N-terminal domain-containing protein [Bacteroides sp.]MCM1442542.1 type I restriction enzyme HsdR N-terminal domain-containing protein [Muribaculum sp.]MCM1481387.1 type I restriction enzyme HsdR N-terminal domain-containing protein [Paludibacter sp.]